MPIMETKPRQRWTEQQQVRKEPALYDEWLREGNKNDEVVATKTPQAKTRRHGSTAGISVAAPGTMPVGNGMQPEAATLASTDQNRGPALSQFHERNAPRTSGNTSSAAASRSTTSVMDLAGSSYPVESSPTLSSSSSRARRKEYEHNELMETLAAQRRPSTRTSSHSQTVSKGKVKLGRHSSKSNNGTFQTTSSPVPALDELRSASASSSPPNRTRTRTMDGRRFYLQPPADESSQKQRHRISSVSALSTSTVSSPPLPPPPPKQQPPQPSQQQQSQPRVRGTDFLASVPAATNPLTTPSITSFAPVRHTSGTHTHAQVDMDAMSSGYNGETSISASGTLPKRIQHLMKTLNGRMSGVLIFRQTAQTQWRESYCFIQEESASLNYESAARDGSHGTLIPDLRGCHVEVGRSHDYVPHVIVRLPRSMQEVHIRINNQTDFDSWIAALLTWQNRGNYRDHGSQLQSAAALTNSSPAFAPPPAQHRLSAARSISPHTRKRADSNRSQNRRKSVAMSLKEAPVIKIGKMIFWDTDVTLAAPSSGPVGYPSAGRPQARRMQSYGSRRWRRISALLRENGELKLHADVDNSLLSVVQLSQLSRCAIQRLDPSVLDNEFSIAMYPQYTSSPIDSVDVLRPIFLSLESRVLHEVWFVLLRAFTIPQLYGPRLPEDFSDGDEERDFEKLLAEQTTDMFRMERALSIRVVEAKLFPNSATDARSTQSGYHVELLLDNETRARTAVRYEGLNPLWGETFEFADLPPVLTNASIVIKRRPPDAVKLAQDGRPNYDRPGVFAHENHGGYSGINVDVTCGKVEMYLDELAASSAAERWWPVVNMYDQTVGEVLVKARADEGVVLMARDYQPLNDLLHTFANGLSLQLAQIVPGELRRLSDCLLNIYQVSGKAGDWIMALVEDEIDSIHKETPITRLRYNGRGGSSDINDHLGSGAGHSDRELMVRDMNKNATLEANLLFRGNTLLTKSLDAHMRRVGKDFLEEALATKLREICERDPDCEVDPNRVSEAEIMRNWKRLIALTSEVWKSIVAAKSKCPIELRRIFRHVRACAEDRYGDFLRSVSYSSVSGFLFLRFFCPAVLNPKLFGLFKDEIQPKGRRTLTLIAKSLQTLANMASFGTKEQWMEPMNIFLNQSREAFKNFIDDICFVPVPISSKSSISTPAPAIVPAKYISADTHLSYTTPMTIMQRLPPTSREGFPSLPYLIDQPRAFAELVQLWLETTSDTSSARQLAFPGKSKADLLAAIRQSDGDVREFHEICVKLNARTQECLSRAERAERPHSALSFQWEDLIDQLQSPTDPEPTDEETQMPSRYSSSTDDIRRDSQAAEPSVKHAQVEQIIGSLALDNGADGIDQAHRHTPSRPQPVTLHSSNSGNNIGRNRGSSTTVQDDGSRNGHAHNTLQSRMLHSRSSAYSPASPTSFEMANRSDVDAAGTTALPSYEREVLHRRREDTEVPRGRQSREPGEKRGQGMKFVTALRKKRSEKDPPGSSGSGISSRTP